MPAKILNSSYIKKGEFNKKKPSISLENNQTLEPQDEQLSKEIDTDIKDIETSDASSLESFINKGQQTISKVQSFFKAKNIDITLKDSYVEYGLEYLESKNSFLKKSKEKTLNALKLLKEAMKYYK